MHALLHQLLGLDAHALRLRQGKRFCLTLRNDFCFSQVACLCGNRLGFRLLPHLFSRLQRFVRFFLEVTKLLLLVASLAHLCRLPLLQLQCCFLFLRFRSLGGLAFNQPQLLLKGFPLGFRLVGAALLFLRLGPQLINKFAQDLLTPCWCFVALAGLGLPVPVLHVRFLLQLGVRELLLLLLLLFITMRSFTIFAALVNHCMLRLFHRVNVGSTCCPLSRACLDKILAFRGCRLKVADILKHKDRLLQAWGATTVNQGRN
mmetsp:Transcript_8762/g.24057  ORF Transcript_8762/g.24057 Transcript_8762/m.24057 type:complete len:260 (-) Transcript_8762:936-1715(-)